MLLSIVSNDSILDMDMIWNLCLAQVNNATNLVAKVCLVLVSLVFSQIALALGSLYVGNLKRARKR